MRLWRDWRKRSTIAWLIKNGDVIQTDYVDVMPLSMGFGLLSNGKILQRYHAHLYKRPINFLPGVYYRLMSDKQSTHEAMPAASTPEGFRSRLLSYLPPSQRLPCTSILMTPPVLHGYVIFPITKVDVYSITTLVSCRRIYTVFFAV